MISIGFVIPFTFWHWFVLGFSLIVLELLFFAGEFLLWIGLGALGAGLFFWLDPLLSPFNQVFAFGSLSLFGLFIGRRWFRLHGEHAHGDVTVSNLRSRGESLLGQTFILDRTIVRGKGRLCIGDVYWLVTGPDLPAGTKVKIQSIEGNILRIQKEKT